MDRLVVPMKAACLLTSITMGPMRMPMRRMSMGGTSMGMSMRCVVRVAMRYAVRVAMRRSTTMWVPMMGHWALESKDAKQVDDKPQGWHCLRREAYPFCHNHKDCTSKLTNSFYVLGVQISMVRTVFVLCFIKKNDEKKCSPFLSFI